jgi:Domain of unknown function (DUF6883)
LRIPNADRAIIDPMKLHGYLLSPSHPIGRLKAAYSIRAILMGPSGRSADLVSVWFVRTGEEVPRFVTAYPEVGR